MAISRENTWYEADDDYGPIDECCELYDDETGETHTTSVAVSRKDVPKGARVYLREGGSEDYYIM